jgi:hypothetical protein
MEDTHPGITHNFSNGMLSVRRTKKRYSGNYHDLTLEQTINKDAANTAQGQKIAFQLLISCRRNVTSPFYLFVRCSKSHRFHSSTTKVGNEPLFAH